MKKRLIITLTILITLILLPISIFNNEVKADGEEEAVQVTAEDNGYLCFTANTAGSTITLETIGSPDYEALYAEVDTSWNKYTLGTKIYLEKAGDKVYFKGLYHAKPDTTDYVRFSMTGSISASGNVLSMCWCDAYKTIKSLKYDCQFYMLFAGCSSLTKAPNLPATELTESCYAWMFAECKNLTEAPKLPATKLATDCYGSMFCDCFNLKIAPELPATTLTPNCYACMFLHCKNLTEAPKLPATNLAPFCYRSMFCDCINLIKAPELPATTLAEECYALMFSNCSKLTTAPSLPATSLAEACYYNMFCDCLSLITAPDLPATTLAKNCYLRMFENCLTLTEIPNIKATSLADGSLAKMFIDCMNIKLSTTQTEGYQTPFSLNITGTEGTDSLKGMFSDTGGTFKGTPETNKTYYVNVNLAIIYDDNSSDAGTIPVDTNNYKKGETAIALDNVGELSKIGYNFVGWNTHSEGIGITYVKGDKITVNADIRLYAKWELRNDIPYTVKHFTQNIDNENEYTLAIEEVLKGTMRQAVKPDTKNLAGFTAPEKTLIFINGDGSSVVEYKYTRNSYTLTVEAVKGVKDCSESKNYKYDEQVSLTATLKDGYKDITYKKGEEVISNTFKMPAVATTVSISATPITYSITYHLNGGVETTNPTSYNIETETITLNNPTKEGYDFKGFYEDEQCEGKVITEITKGSFGDKQLYAKWTKNITYKISDSVNTTYDGEAHGIEVSVNNLNNGYEISYSIDNGKTWQKTDDHRYMLTDVTTNTVTVKFMIQADDYITAITEARTITINKRPITIKSGSASKQEDGEPLTCNVANVIAGSYAKNECFTYNFTGSQLAIGSSSNTFTCTDSDNTKLSNYEIDLLYGKLTVNPEVLAMTTPNFNEINGKISYIKGKANNCVVEIEEPCTDYVKEHSEIYVNDKTTPLTKDCYTITEGSTVLTLKDSYLNTLSPGTYVYKINFNYETTTYTYNLVININSPTPVTTYTPVNTATR